MDRPTFDNALAPFVGTVAAKLNIITSMRKFGLDWQLVSILQTVAVEADMSKSVNLKSILEKGAYSYIDF